MGKLYPHRARDSKNLRVVVRATDSGIKLSRQGKVSGKPKCVRGTEIVDHNTDLSIEPRLS